MDQPPSYEQARFELVEEPVKSEVAADSPQIQNLEPAPQPQPESISPSQPIPSTEVDSSESFEMAATKRPTGPPKKKGTAQAAKVTKKKVPKSRRLSPKSTPKSTPRSTPGIANKEEDEVMDDAPGSGDESDNGPYCLCRGPDDHRWMICCEKCEDWFHGECIDLSKDIGENLIEKFICPKCTNGSLTSLYKKTCGLGACRKPARITLGEGSMFCSNDHAQMWWERMINRLPKSKAKAAGLNDQLTQDEFMALLDSKLAVVDEEGMFRLAKMPFQDDAVQADNGDTSKVSSTHYVLFTDMIIVPEQDLSHVLTSEEKTFLDQAAESRYRLGEETALCKHMVTMLELAQKRRKAAIDAGKIGEDICGYDFRLQTIGARDAFAAFIKSPEGVAILESNELGAPPAEDGDDEDDLIRGLCERKRCKRHQHWRKTLALSIRYQSNLMTRQAAEIGEEERLVREAALERSRRKQAETNYVEVL